MKKEKKTITETRAKDSTKKPGRPKKESRKISAADIRVVGIGGAGCNAVDFMANKDLKDISFISMNTDNQDLFHSKADVKIQIGEKVTRGLGAGANPDMGKLGAEEDREKIKSAIDGSDLLFLTCGMGGGTGTGAAPVVAQIARELGIVTIAVITRPFSFEGTKRKKNSIRGLEELAHHVDTLIVIPNDSLFALPNKSVTLVNAFEAANNILKIGIKGISDLITEQGYINLDFADIKSIVSNSGVAMLGFGYAEGEDRAKHAAEQALNSPLLEKPISGAKKILLNITGGRDVALSEVSQIANMVSSAAGDSATDVIFGTVLDDSESGIKVTVIATDFKDNKDSSDEHVKEEISDRLDIPAFLRRK